MTIPNHLRIFRECGTTFEWHYGPGTINEVGDFYTDGLYVEKAGPSFEGMERLMWNVPNHYEELCGDPDMEMDIGL